MEKPSLLAVPDGVRMSGNGGDRHWNALRADAANVDYLRLQAQVDLLRVLNDIEDGALDEAAAALLRGVSLDLPLLLDETVRQSAPGVYRVREAVEAALAQADQERQVASADDPAPGMDEMDFGDDPVDPEGGEQGGPGSAGAGHGSEGKSSGWHKGRSQAYDAFIQKEIHAQRSSRYAPKHLSSRDRAVRLVSMVEPDREPLPSITLLGYFAVTGNLDAVMWLVERGARPGQVFVDNRDAAWMAMLAGHADVLAALLPLSRKNLRLNSGDRQTRLIAAVDDRDLSTVSTLIASGADPNLRDAKGRTALHINFQHDPYLPSDFRIAQVLMQGKARPGMEDNDGVPAHLYAGDMARAVLVGLDLAATPQQRHAHRAKQDAEVLAAAASARPQVPADRMPQIKRPPPKPPKPKYSG